MKATLTDAQIRNFHEDGYLAVQQITTPEEVGFIREIYDGLFERKAGWANGDLFDFSGDDINANPAAIPQLLNPSHHAPALKKTLFHMNAHAMAKQLLGPSAELVFEHAMLKPARTGGETPWHQDEAFYPRFTNYRSVTFWMPLQAVDIGNGCLDFIPGSNKGALLAHRSINNDPRIHGLEAPDADGSRRVSCPLLEGGATVHHYRTLHHAGPNTSDGPRRAYALGFGVRSAKYTLRTEFPWNVEKATARMKRADEAAGALGRVVSHVKGTAKSVFLRQ
ncbi:MAG: Phytanoyl-CoA dioxygenase [Polaromonas sp.]|nr:Phytanoyl-CoA dioxygenase [Polaromonas sp.]